jgi:hypothetical protein
MIQNQRDLFSVPDQRTGMKNAAWDIASDWDVLFRSPIKVLASDVSSRCVGILELIHH